VTLVILYLFFVRYVCKLDPWAHILLVLGLDLKTGYDRFPVTRYMVYCSYLMDHELL
jgi:hypothetical protein